MENRQKCYNSCCWPWGRWWWWWRFLSISFVLCSSFFFFVFPPSVRSLAWWIPWMGNSWRGSVDTTSCVIVFLFCAPWSLSALFHLTDEHFDEHRHYISQLVFVWFDFLCVCVCVICLTRGWQGMYQFKDELEEGQGKIGIDEANEIMKRKGPVDHLLLTFRN